MSKKGKDFDDGGLYFFKDNKPFDVEFLFDVGDISLFYGRLKHGVQKIYSGRHSKAAKNRWWACFTNPISDEIENRASAKSIY